ncbi:hypothetical protein [Brachybacterium hainanense]|uniref:Uncharacterized protein n=1 Tax=Brachybacterium hainanense TaxID=1541174 RepID=A0ABV6REP3_9MICO
MQKAESLLRTGGGAWDLDSPFSDYIEQVTRPAMEKVKLAPMSKDNYGRGLRLLLGTAISARRTGRSTSSG